MSEDTGVLILVPNLFIYYWRLFFAGVGFPAGAQ
jgi:hypothetical protein